MKYFYFILACYFSAFNNVCASIYSINPSDLIGTYAYPSNAYSATADTTFDLGIQFSSIENVQLVVNASGVEGLYQSCFDSSCTFNTFGQNLNYGFSYEPGYGFSPNGNIALTETPTIYTETINGAFDFLLDGVGSLYISTEIPVFVDIAGLSVNFLSPTTLDIYDLTLNVESTAIPLPPTLWLFCLGVISLFFFNRTRIQRIQPLSAI